MTEQVQNPEPPARISIKEFFEKVAPGQNRLIAKLAEQSTASGRIYYTMQVPPIQLHCDHAACNGVRFFEPTDSKYPARGELKEHFITFFCRNCTSTKKTFAFWSKLDNDGVNGQLMKFGEVPPFGPPTPARLITLIGGERDYFLKGRRAENQGLGIAAFAYYRRVVENQKTKIIQEIIRVSEKLGAEASVLAQLKAALNETQFSSAVAAIKDGVPQSLLIKGHNPLTLLHSALSEGLHAQTDAECLEIATSIRVVLTDLVERMGVALEEEEQLNTAVARLLKASADKANKAQPGN